VPNHIDIENRPLGTGNYKFSAVNDNYMTLFSDKSNIKNIFIRFYETSKDVVYSDCDIIMMRYEDYDKVEGKIGYSVKKYISPEFEVLSVNTTRDILSLSSVRRAIAYGINKKDAAHKISYSKTILSDLPVFPESWIKGANKLTYNFSEEEAKKLLNSVDKSKLVFELLVNEENSERVQYAEYFKESLKNIGITINITKAPTEQINEKLENKDYDLALLGFNIAMIQDIKEFYTGGASNNISGYSNSELDVLISKLEKYILDNERKIIYSEAEDILLTDMPYIGLYFKQHYIMYNKRVVGIEESKPSYLKKLGNIESWQIIKIPEEP